MAMLYPVASPLEEMVRQLRAEAEPKYDEALAEFCKRGIRFIRDQRAKGVGADRKSFHSGKSRVVAIRKRKVHQRWAKK